MVCPYRKMTETVDGTTKEYYMECYGTRCPYYIGKQNYSDGKLLFNGVYVSAYCERPVDDVSAYCERPVDER